MGLEISPQQWRNCTCSRLIFSHSFVAKCKVLLKVAQLYDFRLRRGQMSRRGELGRAFLRTRSMVQGRRFCEGRFYAAKLSAGLAQLAAAVERVAPLPLQEGEFVQAALRPQGLIVVLSENGSVAGRLATGSGSTSRGKLSRV